jgi:hypothetical protein
VRAFGQIMQASAGIKAAIGTPDGGPQKAGMPVTDNATGQCAAFDIDSPFADAVVAEAARTRHPGVPANRILDVGAVVWRRRPGAVSGPGHPPDHHPRSSHVHHPP